MTGIPFIHQVRLAQLDRAFGYGPKGRGFESSNARYKEVGILLYKISAFLFLDSGISVSFFFGCSAGLLSGFSA